MAMLAKDPGDRPDSMALLAELLKEILSVGSRGFAGWTPTSGIPVGRVALRSQPVSLPRPEPITSEIAEIPWGKNS